jgi:CheY-like chemotaxis protein
MITGGVMVHIATANVIDRAWGVSILDDHAIPARYTILVVRDHDKDNDYLMSVCEFLDIRVEHATTEDNLRSMLPVLHPMAVITDLDGDVQDGFHVMKMAAEYDRALPILLLTSNESVLLGAVDAVREVFGLTHIVTATAAAGIGPLVDFICHAARDAGRSRLMRV